jgi:hypothetical protein
LVLLGGDVRGPEKLVLSYAATSVAFSSFRAELV